MPDRIDNLKSTAKKYLEAFNVTTRALFIPYFIGNSLVSLTVSSDFFQSTLSSLNATGGNINRTLISSLEKTIVDVSREAIFLAAIGTPKL